jgi:hypothetical protein
MFPILQDRLINVLLITKSGCVPDALMPSHKNKLNASNPSSSSHPVALGKSVGFYPLFGLVSHLLGIEIYG